MPVSSQCPLAGRNTLLTPDLGAWHAAKAPWPERRRHSLSALGASQSQAGSPVSPGALCPALCLPQRTGPANGPARKHIPGNGSPSLCLARALPLPCSFSSSFSVAFAAETQASTAQTAAGRSASPPCPGCLPWREALLRAGRDAPCCPHWHFT